MELNRSKLVEDLSFFEKALGRNALFPMFQCFHIVGSSVLATDGSCMITGDLEADSGLNCSVPGRELLSLIKGLDSEKVELIQKRDKVHVETIPVRTTAKFLTVGESQSLRFPSYEGLKWFDVPEGLLTGLRCCSFAVASDETSGVLTGVYVVNDEVYGTDKSRAARFFLEKPVDFDAVVPVRFVEIVDSCFDDIESTAITENRIYIRLNNGTHVSSGLLEGNYPSLDQYFPNSESMERVEFEKEIASTIERHVSFLSGTRKIDKHTELTIQGDLCKWLSIDKGLGRIEDVTSLKNKPSEDLVIALNPEFLKEINFSKFYYDPKEGKILIKEGDLEYLVLDRR